MITVIGIDPGQKGGFCAIRQGRIHALWPLPDSLSMIRDLLYAFPPPLTTIYLEKAQSFPKQGISSAFNYGTHYGELRGTFAAMLFRVELVAPGAWARRMHGGASGDCAKAKSLDAARRLFPEQTFIPPGTRGKKPHDGLVDAALIALYGWQKLHNYEDSDECLPDLQETTATITSGDHIRRSRARLGNDSST